MAKKNPGRNASPGTYAIFLETADRPQYPNHVLNDILAEDDFYRGTSVATMQLR